MFGPDDFSFYSPKKNTGLSLGMRRYRRWWFAILIIKILLTNVAKVTLDSLPTELLVYSHTFTFQTKVALFYIGMFIVLTFLSLHIFTLTLFIFWSSNFYLGDWPLWFILPNLIIRFKAKVIISDTTERLTLTLFGQATKELFNVTSQHIV